MSSKNTPDLLPTYYNHLVNRVLRTYDDQRRITEEEQLLEDPTAMFPSKARAKWEEESGLSTVTKRTITYY